MRARKLSTGAKEIRITESKGLCHFVEPCRWCNGRATTIYITCNNIFPNSNFVIAQAIILRLCLLAVGIVLLFSTFD